MHRMLVTKMYSPYFKQYYERIKTGRGAGISIIATARKFLDSILRTLKSNLLFNVRKMLSKNLRAVAMMEIPAPRPVLILS